MQTITMVGGPCKHVSIVRVPGLKNIENPCTRLLYNAIGVHCCVLMRSGCIR